MVQMNLLNKEDLIKLNIRFKAFILHLESFKFVNKEKKINKVES